MKNTKKIFIILALFALFFIMPVNSARAEEATLSPAATADAITAYNVASAAAFAIYNAAIADADKAYGIAYATAAAALPPDTAAHDAATTRRDLAKLLARVKYDLAINVATANLKAATDGAKTTTKGEQSKEDLQSDAALRLNPAKIMEPTQLINRFIKILLAFIGSISLVLYIVSGFLWMTASGNTEKVTKAKSIMVWTTLGVVVMLASYMLVSFVFKSLGL